MGWRGQRIPFLEEFDTNVSIRIEDSINAIDRSTQVAINLSRNYWIILNDL